MTPWCDSYPQYFGPGRCTDRLVIVSAGPWRRAAPIKHSWFMVGDILKIIMFNPCWGFLITKV